MKKDPYKQREARNYDNPIASREFILAQLESLAEPVAFKRLAKTLGLESSGEREALKFRLSAMVRDGQLMVDRRNVYALAKKMELLTGKVSAHPDGYGFLLQEGQDEDVFLTRREMRQVFHGDIVKVRVRGKDRRGRSEGEIVEVLERHTQQLVGRYVVDNALAMLEPLNNRINHEILLREAEEQSANPYTPGQIVVAEIIEQPGKRGVAIAKIVALIGDHLTPGIEVDIALRSNDIPTEWSEEVVVGVGQMSSEVQAEDKQNRFDLTALPFVTIDGEDARDFDDAVYCESKRGGGWRLYVAIADVSHYVAVGSALDEAAYQRGTSVYFPQYVVPMLPEELSNGLCSLKPEVERLVVVCEMTISARGKISGYKFYEGYIYSHARLTYTQVAALIGEGNDETNILRQTYSALLPHIEELHGLYKALNQTRQQRGAIEFDSTELQFQFSEAGKVQDISPTQRNTAHRIIEECMLCANVSAARLISKLELPGLYRVHEPPTTEKVEQLLAFLGLFGIGLDYQGTIQPADYQLLMQQLRDKQYGPALQMSLLRSMNQAVYQVENSGHFGLGYAAYTHFTSPIRRYPDLLTHRLIKSVIHSRTKSKWVDRPGKASKVNYYPYETEQVVEFGLNTSMTERRAESAVYEVLEWIKCDYISDRVGEIQAGVITGVTKFGFFVELSEIFVEGLVHISTLASDYFRYDPQTQCLQGERTQLTYSMGDTVQVQVVRVNVDERKIDFELISHTALLKKVGQKNSKPRRKKAKINREKRTAGKGRDKGGESQGKARRKSKKQQPSKKKLTQASGVAVEEDMANAGLEGKRRNKKKRRTANKKTQPVSKVKARTKVQKSTASKTPTKKNAASGGVSKARKRRRKTPAKS
ncbi:MAG: ribonuclease R [Pseudomonadales bacterium]|nr:ribonuclease R [Pseudomonadales bacterium]